MIVMGSDGISHLASHVRQKLLPSTSDPYTSSDLRFTAMCLDLIAEDYDRAADVFSADRQEMADVFAHALPDLDGDMRGRVSARLESRPENLRVRTLTQVVDDDLRVLIDLHREVEKPERVDQPWAGRLSAKIWMFLESYARRRVYRSPI